MKYANETSYSGSFSAGMREGRGSFVFTDRRVYDGSWVADKMCGKGKLTFPNGDTLEGMWDHLVVTKATYRLAHNVLAY